MAKTVRFVVAATLAVGWLLLAACEFIVDTRGRCQADVDCVATEQCQELRCVPRTSPADASITPDSGQPSTVLAFTTASQMVAAGACSAVVTVENRNIDGAAVAATSEKSVNLAAVPYAGFAFFSDAACSAETGSIALVAGSSSISFWFIGQTAGTTTVTVSGSGFSAATQDETITAGAAAQLAFTSAPQTLVAGACSAPIEVQLQDAFDNTTTAVVDTLIYLSSTSAGGAFFVDEGCLNAVSNATATAGTGSVTVYYLDTVHGSPTLLALASGLTSATQNATITPAGARLAFTTPARSTDAGVCSLALTVQAQDQTGTPVDLTDAAVVALATTSATGSFFSDAGCATLIPDVTIAAGGNQASFYYKDRTPGTPTITASTSGLASATQQQTIRTAAPTRLVIVSPTQTVTAGQCSAAVTVQAQDPSGNAANVAEAKTVALASTSSAASFYTDAGCSAATTTVALAINANQTSFYFRDTTAGTPTLTAATTGLTEADQVETVAPAAPAKLVITTPPQTVNVDVCSAAMTVEVRDGFDNTAPVTVVTTVNLSSSAGTSTFHADGSCGGSITTSNLGQGESQATFYFKDSAIGTPTITAAASGLTDATQTVTLVAAGAAARLAFTTSPQTLNINICSAAATVQMQDSLGAAVNAAIPTSVRLTSGDPGVTFYSDAGCATAATSVSIATGNSSGSFYFKDSTSGAPTLTATVSGLTAASQVETIKAPPAQLQFTTPQQTLIAGSCSSVMSVQSQDSFGNPANLVTTTTVGLATTSGGGAFYSDAGCTTNAASVSIASGTSVASFYYRDTAAGTPTLTASANGLTSDTQTEDVDAAAASRLAFTTAPQSVTAGLCSAVLTVQSRDTYNNPSAVSAATAVTLTSTSSGGGFYSNGDCTSAVTSASINATTDSTSFYYKDALAGSPTITAAAAILDSATQLEAIGPAQPARLAFTSPQQIVNTDACSAVMTVELRDVFDNVAPAQSAVTVNLSSSAGTSAFYNDPACSSAVTNRPIPVDTSLASFYFKDSAVGTPLVTAAGSSLANATQTVIVVAGSSATRLAFTTSPQTLIAGDCSAVVTVQSQNSAGVPTSPGSNATVTLSSSSSGNTFYSGSGCTSPTTTVVINGSANQASFYFKDTNNGTPTLTARATGLTDATQTETISGGASPRLVFTSAPVPVVANGCAAKIMFQSQNADGTPLIITNTAGLNVTLTATPATGFFFHKKNDDNCSREAFPSPWDRLITVGLDSEEIRFVATTPGTYTITASATGYTSGSQQEIVQ